MLIGVPPNGVKFTSTVTSPSSALRSSGGVASGVGTFTVITWGAGGVAGVADGLGVGVVVGGVVVLCWLPVPEAGVVVVGFGACPQAKVMAAIKIADK